MELRDIHARLEAVGRTSPRLTKPKEPKPPKVELTPVEVFKKQLGQQIALLNAGLSKTNKSRWVTEADGKLSVRFGSPAIPVGEKGLLYFKADSVDEAREILSMGEALLQDPKFVKFVENPDLRPSKRKSAPVAAEEEKPKKRTRGPNKPKAK